MKEILFAALLAALPADRETVPMEALAAIAAGDEFPATTTYTKRVEYIDFNSFGQEFTQVVVILTPDTPRTALGGASSSWWAASPAANTRATSSRHPKERKVPVCGSRAAA